MHLASLLLLQAPAELITDTLSDVLQSAGGVLRVGGGALVAGAMLPAQGIRTVFRKIQSKVAEQRAGGQS